MMNFDQMKKMLGYDADRLLSPCSLDGDIYVEYIEFWSLINLLTEMDDRIKDLETKLRQIESYEQEQKTSSNS